MVYIFQGTCLWRRALLASSEVSRIVVPNFSRRLGVEMTVAQGLINRLEKEGFLKNPAKGKRWDISNDGLCIRVLQVCH
jgi:hypothetical protein